MNFEAIKISLRTIGQEVEAELSKAMSPNRPKPGEPAFQMLETKATRWNERISLLEREIKSQANLAQVQGAHAPRRGPGAYAARQSTASRLGNARDLNQLARDVTVKIADLGKALTTPRDPHTVILEALAEALDQQMTAQKDAQALSELTLAPGPGAEKVTAVVKQAPPGGPPLPVIAPGQPGSMLLVLSAAIALLKLAMKPKR